MITNIDYQRKNTILCLPAIADSLKRIKQRTKDEHYKKLYFYNIYQQNIFSDINLIKSHFYKKNTTISACHRYRERCHKIINGVFP